MLALQVDFSVVLAVVFAVVVAAFFVVVEVVLPPYESCGRAMARPLRAKRASVVNCMLIVERHLLLLKEAKEGRWY